MLRIAIIGIGWAGIRHVEAIGELDRKITVDCLVDNDPEHLKSKAEELGIKKTYTNYHDALADPEVDAVSICTPHHLHGSIAMDAATQHKHVLCEKPLALTVEDANRMIAAAETHGVKLYVAENQSYTPMSKFLRHIVQTGEFIGELTFASMTAGFRAHPVYGYPGRRAWLSTPEIGGTGTWMLHGIHSMAQLRFILGEVEIVYMQEHKASSFQRTDVEGTMSGLLTMESGIQVSVVQTCETRVSGNLGGYVIHGDQGSIRAYHDGCDVYGNGGEPQFLSYPPAELSDYAQEMEAFADYVADISVGPTTGISERRSLAIVQAGYESAKSGEPIHLKRRFGAL